MKTQQAEWFATRERGSALLLRSMAFLSLRVGRTLSRGVLYGIAVYFFLFAPGARRHSRRYLRLALGRRPSANDRFRQILYFATCIHDRLFLINEQYDRFHITIEGESLVRAQLDAGRGAFLLGAHLGSFELMRSVGRRQPGLHVSMAMYEHNAQKMKTVLAAINPGAKADIIALGEIDAMLRIAEHLDRGAFVGVLGDRTLGEEAVQAVTVLGERAYLPMGPMRAAADAAPSGDFHGRLVSRQEPLSRGFCRGCGFFRRFRPAGAMRRCARRSSATRHCSTNIAARILTIGSISSISGASDPLARVA